MFESDLARLTCCDCGVVFGMVDHHYRDRKRDGKSFHCPNGHAQSFQETEEDRLRKRLELSDRRARIAADAEHELRLQNRSLRGVITKLKKSGAKA